ncbi:MAG: hypothetical protein OEZ39_01910 [Gammaproteobacteria bacterium]|nr:hypothetical protein [Gammaproteobacteria bacterium]MDH5650609.1 hypothetical protein [Gammaproteobacteria bacterium]
MHRLKLTAALAVALFSSNVSADLLYQFTTGSAQFGLISSFDAGNSVYLQIGTEQTGKTHLIYATYTPTDGLKYWNGVIPAEAVTTTGLTEMNINIDTCTVSPTAACGLVNLTITKDAASTPLINTGVSQSSFDRVLYQTAGSTTSYTADANGSVNGVAVNTTSRAWIGRYSNVTVTVAAGN